MSSGDRRPRYSVVVATLDEGAEIAETLVRARTALGPDAELIVVDGGSGDDTAALARPLSRLIVTVPGRGHQFRLGAESTSGDVLLFLHADTWLEEGAGQAIEAALDRGAVAGCLRFAPRCARNDSSERARRVRLRYRILAAAINWRTRVFRTATGDQTLFATREAYDAAGGMPPVPLFEDVRFVRRVRRVGPFALVDARALTSTRRWETDGFVATIGRHLRLRAAEALGGDPADLAHRYGRGTRVRPVSRRSAPPS